MSNKLKVYYLIAEVMRDEIFMSDSWWKLFNYQKLILNTDFIENESSLKATFRN